MHTKILVNCLKFLIFIGVYMAMHTACIQAQNNDQNIPKGKEVIIQNTEVLESITTDSMDVKMLSGNVVLIQGDVIFECDSAVVFFLTNNFDAYGNIHINQNDTLNIYGDKCNYQGNARKAKMIGNVVLEDCSARATSKRLDYFLDEDLAILTDKVFITDQKVKVYTDSLRYTTDQKKANLYGKNKYIGEDGNVMESRVMAYDFLTQQGNYDQRGTIKNGNTIIESNKGQFFEAEKKAFFQGDVVINDPDYKLKTESLEYFTELDKAFFSGPTRIDRDSTIIKTNQGWYDKKNEIVILSQGAEVYSKEQTVLADSIYFDDAAGKGFCYRKVSLEDTLNKTLITGEYVEFERATDYILATDHPILRNVSGDGDTLFMMADTLVSIGNGKEKPRKLNAYNDVWMWRPDFQGVCDSLYYSSEDSLFRFFRSPILWMDSTQLRADTVLLHAPNNKPKNIKLRENSFVVNWIESMIYNQLKGKTIDGFFKDNKLHKMQIDTMAQSIYYAQDDAKKYIGANKSSSASIHILFNNGKAERVKFLTAPKAEFVPMGKINPETNKLEGFSWLIDMRPLSLADMKYKRSQGLHKSMIAQQINEKKISDTQAQNSATDPTIKASERNNAKPTETVQPQIAKDKSKRMGTQPKN